MNNRLCLVFFLFAAACGDDSSVDGGAETDGGLDSSLSDANVVDVSTRDARITDGSMDAGSDALSDVGDDAPPCTECGGECTDLMTSLEHCGMCDSPCAGDNADGTCAEGICAVSCREGFADCDGAASNGCESDLSAPATCGSCENACVAGQGGAPTCEVGVCGIACDEGLDRCEDLPFAQGCPVVLASSLEHCGGCDQTCAAGAFASAALCAEGMCSNVCDAGRGDCDGSVMNGCEADTTNDEENCGMCGNACDAVSHCNMSACERRAVAFVTSTRAPPSTFGGIAGADAICAARAAAAGLPGSFLAWLSDSTTSPAARFTPSANGYVRVDGEVVAFSWNDLTDGSLQVAIDVDEFGMPVSSTLSTVNMTCNLSHVITGTRRDGTALSGFDCMEWTGVRSGVGGETTTIGTRWTEGCGGSYACSEPMRLYCFEQ